MILFPAIDLKDGLCVRLQQGDMARATIFNRDPAAQAHVFETQGFRNLHVVDLDGAFAGKPIIGGGAGEATDHATLAERAHLLGIRFDDGLTDRHLAVAADDDAAALAHRQNGCAVPEIGL